MEWLQQYEARLRAATPGPWIWMEELDAIWHVPDSLTDDPRDVAPTTVCGLDARIGYEEEDAEFIAASPEMVAKLIAAVRMAYAQLACVANYDIDVTVYDGAVESAKEMQMVAEEALDKLQSGEFGTDGGGVA